MELSYPPLQLLNLVLLLLFLLPRQLLMRAQPGIQIFDFLAHPANMGLLLPLLVSQGPNLLDLCAILDSQVLDFGVDALDFVLGPHLVLLDLLLKSEKSILGVSRAVSKSLANLSLFEAAIVWNLLFGTTHRFSLSRYGGVCVRWPERRLFGFLSAIITLAPRRALLAAGVKALGRTLPLSQILLSVL